MKYRDFIFVLMLVAVGVLWWTGPQSAEADSQPPKRGVQTEEPKDAMTPTGPAKEPALPKTDIPRPVLEVTPGPSGQLDALVISAHLTSTDPFSLRLDRDGDPVVNLSAAVGEKSWTFRTFPLLTETALQQSYTDLEWEVHLSELEPPEGLEDLRKAFATEKISWTLSLEEPDDKSDIMSRRVVLMPPLASFTTQP